MPPEDLQQLVLSAEMEAAQGFLTLMHRSWAKLKVEHRGKGNKSIRIKGTHILSILRVCFSEKRNPKKG